MRVGRMRPVLRIDKGGTVRLTSVVTALPAGLVWAAPAPALAQSTCNGLAVTITGTAGDDVLVGTARDDVIAALGGNDRVSGLDGDDTVCPGMGDDTLDGGPGRDTLVAEAVPDGRDSFVGGSDGSRDLVTHQARTTRVFVSLDGVADDGEPGEGDNVGADVENVRGGTGNNVITGNTSANVLIGGQSADIIRGADGISGNDRINGEFGTDLCTADKGDTVERCEL